jgi:hypothetical protein
LFLRPHRVVEHVDRRVMGGFQLVDIHTNLPVRVPADIRLKGATLKAAGGDQKIPVDESSVRLRQNLSGMFVVMPVVMPAHLFEDYGNSFEGPQEPQETHDGPLRLQLAAAEVGPHHLPCEFHLDLPRSLDPDPKKTDTVFFPLVVGLFRAPGSPVNDGWAVLRVRVTRMDAQDPSRDTNDPLPGVVLQVFRSPRSTNDHPIGMGMTEWRGRLRGEAIVPVVGLRRFRSGLGSNVVETEEKVVIEMTRDTRFAGASQEFPDVPRILGNEEGVIHPPQGPPSEYTISAGREFVFNLAMP